jgi:F-type H+-transporting ATPase subunit b
LPATALLALAEGGSSIINPDGSLVLIFVLFIVFVFALNRVLFKPVGRVLDERETLTDGARSEARAASRRYQARLDDYESRIRDARVTTYRQLEQRRAAALEERRLLIEESKNRAVQEIELAKSEIARQVGQARTALETESRQIAERIFRTVLGRPVAGGRD